MKKNLIQKFCKPGQYLPVFFVALLDMALDFLIITACLLERLFGRGRQRNAEQQCAAVSMSALPGRGVIANLKKDI
jgi:hypothetical protein